MMCEAREERRDLAVETKEGEDGEGEDEESGVDMVKVLMEQRQSHTTQSRRLYVKLVAACVHRAIKAILGDYLGLTVQ